ncbi:hypothetical protein F2Q68_00030086 [Brassica cretica]|uniref:O-fucosyltransferase family protein n=1 Tax=Brassica cretica TaxID=69181 RepID=A0A8S9GFK8_BRACR|nr:hypothetical protein F2Q68_00030086 [Brassica cretica]
MKQLQPLHSLNQTQRIALAGVLALLLPIFSPNLFRPLGRASPSLFSEWNAPRPRHLRLLEGALHRQISIRQQVELWSPLPDQSWKPCTQSFTGSPLPEKSQGFLQVFLDGGLNQQRMGICDAVAVAKILNVTLVIPRLEVNPDMAAHSGCDFGGGKAEKLALAKYRQVIWQGRVLNSQFTDEELRNKGRCPLTPEEIGLLLSALGFTNNTRLYLASHQVYGGEARISTLRKLFPVLENKKSLASAEELAEVEGKASLMAAVDYYVSMKSDIFISASPGNMHNALLAHRAYLNLKTINPNMILLGQVLVNKSLGWSEFEGAVVNGHKNRQGQLRLRKQKQSIYTYPAPDCMCKAA